jgi:hypothetical protein
MWELLLFEKISLKLVEWVSLVLLISRCGFETFLAETGHKPFLEILRSSVLLFWANFRELRCLNPSFEGLRADQDISYTLTSCAGSNKMDESASRIRRKQISLRCYILEISAAMIQEEWATSYAPLVSFEASPWPLRTPIRNAEPSK